MSKRGLTLLHFPSVFYIVRYFGKSIAVLATRFKMISCLAYFSTLKMEATCSCETSVNFQRTTRRYIPENFIWSLDDRWNTNWSKRGRKRSCLNQGTMPDVMRDLRETMDIFNHDSRCPCRDLNWAPPEDEYKALPLYKLTTLWWWWSWQKRMIRGHYIWSNPLHFATL
jgi:hypothetical protein